MKPLPIRVRLLRSRPTTAQREAAIERYRRRQKERAR